MMTAECDVHKCVFSFAGRSKCRARVLLPCREICTICLTDTEVKVWECFYPSLFNFSVSSPNLHLTASVIPFISFSFPSEA